MCKILAMPGIPKQSEEKAKQFLRMARHFLTENDKDGFGYAMVGEKGLNGERWLKTNQAFTGPKKAKHYSAFGVEQEDCYSLIAHSRMATCGKSIDNVHPFVDGDTALIHNGIISNSNELTLKTSTCDSETILNEYLAKEAHNNPEKIQEVVNRLKGWFACAVLTNSAADGWVVDIIKDDTTPLYFAYLLDLDCPVICTSDSVIQKTARLLRLTVVDEFRIPPKSFIRFNAETGEVLHWFNFTQKKPKWSKSDYVDGWRSATPTTITSTATGSVSSIHKQEKPTPFVYEIGDLVSTSNMATDHNYEVLARRTNLDTNENEYKMEFLFSPKQFFWEVERYLYKPGSKAELKPPQRWYPNMGGEA